MTTTSARTTRLLSDSTDSLLRFAMRADATLSGLMGVAMAVDADWVARLSGTTSAQELAMGVFFIVYGVTVFGLAALPNVRRAGIGVVVANLGYTVLAIVAAELVPMTGIGVAATLASGVYTAAFAGLQYLGVRRLAA